MTEQIGHIRTEDECDVMTLGRMFNTDDAVDYLYRKWGIEVAASTLTKARKRDEIVASVFGGRTVMFAERDLDAWVASRYGNSQTWLAAASEAQRGNQYASRANRDAKATREAGR